MWDVCHVALLTVFVIPVTLSWTFTISGCLNLIAAVVSTRFFTKKQDHLMELAKTTPHVTIQICTHNERRIVLETIHAACKVDWPNLSVQILDDSTDEESIRIIQDCVSTYQQRGIDIVRLTRPDRVGYKAGNLRFHFDAVQSEFVAIFDADHRPEVDFLKRTIPCFYDKEENPKEDIALVQTPWAYFNIHQNLLAESDALSLDVHHVKEQTGRAALYQFFGFNGTGGVWRTEAIKKSGGFTCDSVTEDLAISYQAYLKGYRFVYLRDLPQKLGVTSTFQAHVQQRHRWTKGFIQTLRKSYMDIFTSPNGGWLLKYEALCQMTSGLQYISAATVLITYPFLVWHGIDSTLVKVLSLTPVVESVLSAVIAVYAKVPERDGRYNNFVSRTMRLAIIFPSIALRCGMCLFEIKAILEGLISNDVTFLTTPKEQHDEDDDQSETIKSVAKSANPPTHRSMDDVVALLGLLLACHRLLFVIAIEIYFQENKDTSFNTTIRILNLVLCTGLFWVNGGFLFEKYRKFCCYPCITVTRALRWPGFFPALFLVCCYTSVCINSSTSLGNQTVTTSRKQVILSPPNQGRVKDEFVCSMAVDSPAQGLSPFVVLADPRTGSNLFFEFLLKLHHLSDRADLTLRTLYEAFRDDPTARLKHATKHLQEMCSEDIAPATFDRSFGMEDKEFYKYFQEQLRNSPSVSLKSLLEMNEIAREQPFQYLNYLSRLPTTSNKGYFAFKIFEGHFPKIGTDPDAFIKAMNDQYETKFAVLWRRRMIEPFVSYEIALAKDSWLGEQKTQADAIYVDRTKLESFIEEKKAYYLSVRSALEGLGVDYAVFEYERDLKDAPSQLRAIQTIQSLLNVSNGTITSNEAILGHSTMKKQSQVPLQDMVLNWEEVCDWGYCGESDAWEDLFPGK